MTAVPVQRVNASTRDALVAHFLALPAEDRRLRFGSSISPAAIESYVAGIDFDRDTVFAVHDDRLAPIGVAHVAFADDVAELGLSVLPAHRGCGVGSALFERAAVHVRNRYVPRLFMHCLQENAPIMRMAQRFGMDIVVDSGDADAHLRLPRASPASITDEFMTHRYAQFDHAFKSNSAAWKRINAALAEAAPAPPRCRTRSP